MSNVLCHLYLHLNCNAGVSVELTGIPVSNFGLLGHSQIGTNHSHDVDDVGSSLLVCRTDNTSCCRGADSPNGRGFGNWYHPDGSLVPFLYARLRSGEIYKMQRRTQVVRLIHESSANITTGHNGIYRCEVANQNGVIQTRYLGLYTDGAGEFVCDLYNYSHMHMCVTDTYLRLDYLFTQVHFSHLSNLRHELCIYQRVR